MTVDALSQGARIRAARQAAGLTQLALALAIGVRERTVIRWENGYHLPSDPAIYERIAKATGVPVDDLLEGEAA